jgi:hypothetical protein
MHGVNPSGNERFIWIAVMDGTVAGTPPFCIAGYLDFAVDGRRRTLIFLPRRKASAFTPSADQNLDKTSLRYRRISPHP